VRFAKLAYESCARCEFSDAIPYYRKAIDLNPKLPNWHARLARAYHRIGETDAAISSFLDAIQLNDSVAGWHAQLANILCEQEKWSDAIPYYRKAIDLNPKLPNWHARLARAYHRIGETDAAISSFLDAIQLNDSMAGWHAELANILCEQEKWSDARKHYRKAISINPEIPEWKAELAEIEGLIKNASQQENRQHHSKIEKNANWYNIIYTHSQKYREHYEKSIYFPVWRLILDHIIDYGIEEILDIGCGPGQLACAIRDNITGVKYHGVDISLKAIEIAREVCPEFSFEVRDGLCALQDWKYYGKAMVLCLEVLEHLQDDIEIVRKAPIGVMFAASVPNFSSLGHLRFFKKSQDVVDRYARFFSDFSLLGIPLSATSKIYLFRGNRNEVIL
jgi:tetratricopeptide (TPR) repeat protein